MIRLIEKPQKFTMRISPPCSHQHGLHTLMARKIGREGRLHRQCNPLHVKIISFCAIGDELVDFGEGVWGRDETCWNWFWGVMVVVEDVDV